ncbi:MAG: damage-inducible protein CinA [Desulfuromonas sp.]|nr:MAG: damage-inducible protein CinA [Desulfuromonas sp.]
MPKIAILAIGDELLNGSLSDTNSAAIARLLAQDGFIISEVRIVGDETGSMTSAVAELAGRFDVLITTGGLGPTTDDLTAEALAVACGTELALNEDALRLVDAYFERLGRPKHQRNIKSATMPIGATPLQNPRGTAPGIQLQRGTCQIFSLPGVPDEMTAMIDSAIRPELVRIFGRQPYEPERILTLFGIPEPLVEEKLLAVGLPVGVALAFGVEFPLVLVKLRATGANAAGRLDQAVAIVESVYIEQIVARGSATLADTTAAMLIESGKTLALAESCTGGLIGKMLTDIPGSSAFLDRGAITYSNQAKHDWLNVSKKILEEEGAVSESCARAMAEGIRQSAATDYALAVTGIAGPDGGTTEKPVGTVFVGLAGPAGTIVERYQFTGDRGRIRMRTACAGLAMLQQRLRKES